MMGIWGRRCGNTVFRIGFGRRGSSLDLLGRRLLDVIAFAIRTPRIDHAQRHILPGRRLVADARRRIG